MDIFRILNQNFGLKMILQISRILKILERKTIFLRIQLTLIKIYKYLF